MKVTLFETLDEKQRRRVLAVAARLVRSQRVRSQITVGKRTATAFAGRDVFVLTNRGWV